MLLSILIFLAVITFIIPVIIIPVVRYAHYRNYLRRHGDNWGLNFFLFESNKKFKERLKGVHNASNDR